MMNRYSVIGIIRHDELLYILLALSRARPDLAEAFCLVADAVGVGAALGALCAGLNLGDGMGLLIASKVEEGD